MDDKKDAELNLVNQPSRLRIIYVTPDLNIRNPSGIDVQTYELTKWVSAQGNEVIVYAPELPKGTKEYDYGVKIRRFPYFSMYRLPKLIRKIRTFKWAIDYMRMPIHILHFFEELSKEECDVIHIFGHEYFQSLIAMMAAVKAKIPTVLEITGLEEGLNRFLLVRLLRKIARLITFRYVINSATVIVIRSKHPLQLLKRYNPKRIVLIPQGIDLERFKRAVKGSEYVLYLGRLNPVKRPEIFIKSIPLILKKVNTSFIIGGDGVLRPELERLVKSLGIEKHVKFIGKVRYIDVVNLLSRASVFVAPGPAGHVLLEAAAAQKPIVSASVPWNLDMIGEDRAIFIESDDPKEIAEAVVMLLKDRIYAEKLAQEAYNYVVKTRSAD